MVTKNSNILGQVQYGLKLNEYEERRKKHKTNINEQGPSPSQIFVSLDENEGMRL